MFDFLKRNKKKEQIVEMNDNLIILNKHLQEISAELANMNAGNATMRGDIQLILGYISQIRFAETENVKNSAFANALNFLDAQYNSSDSIMGIEEIKKYYEGIRNEIFIEYNEDFKSRLKTQEEGEEK